VTAQVVAADSFAADVAALRALASGQSFLPPRRRDARGAEQRFGRGPFVSRMGRGAELFARSASEFSATLGCSTTAGAVAELFTWGCSTTAGAVAGLPTWGCSPAVAIDARGAR
jgi:hypothetical protein